MSFKVDDRCKVFFAGLTKGNISKSTSSSIMESIKKIQNSPEKIEKFKIPKNILCALEKKEIKHKELAIGLQLSMLHVKEAECHYNAGIKQQEAMLNEQQKFVASRPSYERYFVENFNKLGGSLKTRFSIAKELYVNKIHYYSGDEIRSMARGKENALGNKVRELREMENSRSEKNYVAVIKHHSKEYSQLENNIKKRRLEISNLKNEAKRCDNLLRIIILKVAIKNKESLSPQQILLLNDFKKAIWNAEAAPRIIEIIKSNIEKLESSKSGVSDYKHQLEQLLILKEAYVSIKETNELLKELHANNEEMSFFVNKTMSEEKNKIDEVAKAFATPGSAPESATKVGSSKLTDSMVENALSELTEVPGDEYDIKFSSENNQRKSKPSRLKSSRIGN